MRELKNEYERHQEKKGKEGKKWKEKNFHLFLKIISYFSVNISSTRDQALLSIIYIQRYILVFIIKVKNNLSCRQKIYFVVFVSSYKLFFLPWLCLCWTNETWLAMWQTSENSNYFVLDAFSNEDASVINRCFCVIQCGWHFSQTSPTLRSSRVSWRKIRPTFVHHLDILQAC